MSPDSTCAHSYFSVAAVSQLPSVPAGTQDAHSSLVLDPDSASQVSLVVLSRHCLTIPTSFVGAAANDPYAGTRLGLEGGGDHPDFDFVVDGVYSSSAFVIGRLMLENHLA